MNAKMMKDRTKEFALKIIKFVGTLPKDRAVDIISRQLLKSGTSVGANYRSACRAKSNADFISKMGIVEEEADEVIYWLELLSEGQIIEKEDASFLIDEANQIVAIAVTSIKTARTNVRPVNPQSAMRNPQLCRGFSLIGAIMFLVIVSICVGVMATMIGNISKGSVTATAATVAGALAEGRMEYIQGLPFSSLASAGPTSFGGAYAQFSYQIVVEYVNGPSDLDTAVAGPTNYRKVTVRIIQSQGLIDNVELKCIKVSRT